MSKIEIIFITMDIVLICHHKKIKIAGKEEELVFPLQDYLLTILKYLNANVTIRITEDLTLQDEIFGELPYLIVTTKDGITKFITRGNIPKFISAWTTLDSWLTEKQLKSVDYIQHYILNLNPSIMSETQPKEFHMFQTKFLKINSEFQEYEINNSILSILSNKLADKEYFYSSTQMCSIDFLAYNWLKHQYLQAKIWMDERKIAKLNLYKNLKAFVDRLDVLLAEAHADIAKLKNSQSDDVNFSKAIPKPEEISSLEWKERETMLAALEEFKQRDAVLLDGKIKYKRTDTYAKESRKDRYIRFGVSIGILFFLSILNRPTVECQKI